MKAAPVLLFFCVVVSGGPARPAPLDYPRPADPTRPSEILVQATVTPNRADTQILSVTAPPSVPTAPTPAPPTPVAVFPWEQFTMPPTAAPVTYLPLYEQKVQFAGYAQFEFNSLTQTIALQDKIMDAVCSAEYPSTVAAYTRQIMLKLIDGLPVDNDSGFTAMAKCQDGDCTGRAQSLARDETARLCVLPSAPRAVDSTSMASLIPVVTVPAPAAKPATVKPTATNPTVAKPAPGAAPVSQSHAVAGPAPMTAATAKPTLYPVAGPVAGPVPASMATATAGSYLPKMFPAYPAVQPAASAFAPAYAAPVYNTPSYSASLPIGAKMLTVPSNVQYNPAASYQPFAAVGAVYGAPLQSVSQLTNRRQANSPSFPISVPGKVPIKAASTPAPIYGAFSTSWPAYLSDFHDNCYTKATVVTVCVKPTLPVNPTNGAGVFAPQCVGNCGKKVGFCYCDDQCSLTGDCCPGFVYQEVCAELVPVSTVYIPPVVSAQCIGHCGNKVGFCYCDDTCHISGDCCPGFVYSTQCSAAAAVANPKLTASIPVISSFTNATAIAAAATSAAKTAAAAVAAAVVPTAAPAVQVVGVSAGEAVYNYPNCGAGCLTTTGKQKVGAVYKVDNVCYRALSDCGGCLHYPPLYPTHLQLIPCPDPSNGVNLVCKGQCGNKVGFCWCDATCSVRGDCCPGFVFTVHCAAADVPAAQKASDMSCKGQCGGYTGKCWCDYSCMQTKDCCADIDLNC